MFFLEIVHLKKVGAGFCDMCYFFLRIFFSEIVHVKKVGAGFTKLKAGGEEEVGLLYAQNFFDFDFFVNFEKMYFALCKGYYVY